MIGLVLCCDPSERKAVLWCEDQGDLAFFAPGEDDGDLIESLEAGDMVEFDVTIVGAVRCARSVAVVRPNSHPDLPDALRKTARIATQPRTIGNVVSFPAMPKRSAECDRQAQA